MSKQNKDAELYFASGSLAVILLLANIFAFHSAIIDVAVIVIIITTNVWMKKGKQEKGQ